MLKLAFISFLTLFIHQMLYFPNDCERFKTGEFYYRMSIGGVRQVIDLIRTDTTQTERLHGSELYSKYRIEWINSCTYDLKLLESNVNYPKAIDSIRWTTNIRSKIMKTGEDYYVFITNSIVTGKPHVDTIWRASEQPKTINYRISR